MNLFTILVIFAVLFCIIYLISKKIHQMQIKREFEEEKRRKEELKRREQERDKQERRNMYYKSLPNIYNHLSTQMLRKSYQLLMNTDKCHKSLRDYEHRCKTIPGEHARLCEAWCEASDELVAFINPTRKKLWMVNDEYSDKPLWYDLDLQYIKNLLNRR